MVESEELGVPPRFVRRHRRNVPQRRGEVLVAEQLLRDSQIFRGVIEDGGRRSAKVMRGHLLADGAFRSVLLPGLADRGGGDGSSAQQFDEAAVVGFLAVRGEEKGFYFGRDFGGAGASALDADGDRVVLAVPRPGR